MLLLREENNALRKEVEELKGLLKEKSMPSFIKADIPIYHHKSGQKEGHEGVSRETPEKIDEIKEHKLKKCPISSLHLSSQEFLSKLLRALLSVLFYDGNF